MGDASTEAAGTAKYARVHNFRSIGQYAKTRRECLVHPQDVYVRKDPPQTWYDPTETVVFKCHRCANQYYIPVYVKEHYCREKRYAYLIGSIGYVANGMEVSTINCSDGGPTVVVCECQWNALLKCRYPELYQDAVQPVLLSESSPTGDVTPLKPTTRPSQQWRSGNRFRNLEMDP